MKILVTGGCGFIGSNYIRLALQTTGDRIINFDKLTYAGHPESLAGADTDPRYEFVRGDIAEPGELAEVFSGAEIDAVVNFAAESHVDRSIDDAGEFIRTNIVGVQNLIDLARRAGVGRFAQVSTDEVYGSLGRSGKFTEETPPAPNSPYAASKAAADLLLRAAFKTHGFPAVVTRCCNNYGPFQTPEKLIPLMILKARRDQELPVYGDGSNVRDWIHVRDHAEAVDLVLRRGRPGQVYNIGADSEWSNIDIVKKILDILGKPESLIRFVTDRPGHDWRYAIDARKIMTELGWQPAVDFDAGLQQTVDWYLNNDSWLEAVQARNRDILQRKGAADGRST